MDLPFEPSPPDDAHIRAHADLVFRTCLRLTGNAQDAADVSQEVFIAWLQAQGTIRGPVGAWLHGTARLRALEFLRRSHRRHTHERETEVPAVEAPDPGMRSHLDEALSELDGTSRALVIEHHLMGIEQSDLAARFRCTQATVSRRIAKALEQMRILLVRRGVTASFSAVPMLLADELGYPHCPLELIEPVLAQVHVAGSHALLGPATLSLPKSGWVVIAVPAVLVSALAVIASVVLAATLPSPSHAPDASSAPPDPPAPAAPPMVPFVSRSGQYLVLDRKPIHLHGGSLYGAPWRQSGFNAYADTWLAKAHDNGMNTIRVVDFLDTDKADWMQPLTWANIDYLMGAAAAKKTLIILDLSTYRNMLEKTNSKDIADKEAKAQAAVTAAYDPERWAPFTDFVAGRYKDATNLAFYSIAGECEAPIHKRITTEGLTTFFARVSTQLRTGDPHHLISTGGLEFLDWDAGIDWKSIFRLPNIQLANVHVYSKGDASVLPRIAEWTRQPAIDIPFVVEEFGIKQGTDDPARAAQFKDIYALGSLYGSVGTLFWNIGPEQGSGSCDVGPQTPTTWMVARECETYFHSGFEASDAQPTIGDPAQAAAADCVLRAGGVHSGERALHYASTTTRTTPSTITIYRVGLAIRPSTMLRYWINPEQDSGRFVAVDLHCSDGGWLHDTAAVDTKSRSMGAKAGHGGSLPLNEWSEIRCGIGRWLDGKMVDAIVIAYDHPSAATAFGAAIDDLVITNGTP